MKLQHYFDGYNNILFELLFNHPGTVAMGNQQTVYAGMTCKCFRAVDPSPPRSTTPPNRSSPPVDKWADNGNNSDPELADLPPALDTSSESDPNAEDSDDSDSDVFPYNDSAFIARYNKRWALRPGAGTVLRPPDMEAMDVEKPKTQEHILQPESVHQMMQITSTVADCSPVFCVATSGMGKTHYLNSTPDDAHHKVEDIYLVDDLDKLLGKAPPHWKTQKSIVSSDTRKWYVREGTHHALDLIPGMGGWECWMAAMMRRALMTRQRNGLVGCVVAGLFHSSQPDLMVRMLKRYFLASDAPNAPLELVPPLDAADRDLPHVYKIPQRQIVCLVPEWELYKHRAHLRCIGPDGGGRKGRHVAKDHAWNGLLCMRAIAAACPLIQALEDFDDLTPLLLRRKAGHIGSPAVYQESQARAKRAKFLNPLGAAITLHLEQPPWVAKAAPPKAPSNATPSYVAPSYAPKPPPPTPEVGMLPPEPAGSSGDVRGDMYTDIHFEPAEPDVLLVPQYL